MTTTCHVRHHGSCERVMSAPSVIATLEYHGVAARVVDTTVGPIVEVWEEAAMRDADGSVRDVSAWVTVPCTLHGLADWLGY